MFNNKMDYLIQPLCQLCSQLRGEMFVFLALSPPAWVLVFSTAVTWCCNWVIVPEKKHPSPQDFVGKGSFINVPKLRFLWEVQTINSTGALRDRKEDDNVMSMPPRNTSESRCHWKLGQKRKNLIEPPAGMQLANTLTSSDPPLFHPPSQLPPPLSSVQVHRREIVYRTPPPSPDALLCSSLGLGIPVVFSYTQEHASIQGSALEVPSV